ncbi:acyl carrier protein [Flavobacterium silvaticum]|uniref:Acyl carrier protein n=1 Tax=Flavobacterium silvaticum TaxID=1852020 RepID=A0A972JGF2_9FLAO|nr:acyl carrier protein [Flavobacterium silvaticum]NMH28979.1 acyl carrier protein [Flavobacterium silvaticum]
MTQTEIIDTLKSIVKPYVQNQQAFETLDEKTDFVKDLQINSANLVDIALDTEDAFGIEIDNESMQRMLTVEAALSIIEEKRAQK